MYAWGDHGFVFHDAPSVEVRRVAGVMLRNQREYIVDETGRSQLEQLSRRFNFAIFLHVTLSHLFQSAFFNLNIARINLGGVEIRKHACTRR